MKNWILGILAIVVISVLSDIILSDSSIGKFTKKIIGVSSVLMILFPIVKLVNIDINKIFEYNYIQDDDFIDYFNSTQKEYLEYYIAKSLDENGFENVDVEIEYNLSNNESDIEKVIINLKNLVIKENITHINKYEEIKNIVKAIIDIEEGKIILNE